MNKDFLTIQEAARLVKKSDLTIRRLVKSGHLIGHQETADGGLKWYIQKESLLKHYQSTISQETNQVNHQDDQVMSSRDDQSSSSSDDHYEPYLDMISLLKNELEKRDDQLRVKDGQIGDLGRKIDQLIERGRETNIIMMSLQERVKMLDSPKPAAEQEPTQETVGEAQQPETVVHEHVIHVAPDVSSEPTLSVRLGDDEPVSGTLQNVPAQPTEDAQPDTPAPKKRGLWQRIFRSDS